MNLSMLPGLLGPPIHRRRTSGFGVAGPYESPCLFDEGQHQIWYQGGEFCVVDPPPGVVSPCPNGTLLTAWGFTGEGANRHSYPVCTPVDQLGPCPIGQLRTATGDCICPPGQTKGPQGSDPRICISTSGNSSGVLGGLLNVFQGENKMIAFAGVGLLAYLVFKK